jgi:hypothetical protein
VLRRLALEAKAGEVTRLALGPLILLGAGGGVAREVEVTEGGTRSGQHLPELLLLLVPKAVLLPLGDLLLSLWNLCNVWNFLASRAISSLGMLSYCSSEAAHKEDKVNSKADKLVVLVGLATWPPESCLEGG